MATRQTAKRRLHAGAAAFLAGLACMAVTAPAANAKAEVEIYRGAGAWVDIFDFKSLGDPILNTQLMASQGVKTLYIETGNYRQASDIVSPTTVAAYVDAAHAAGLKVVAWYLPGFGNLSKDLRRSRAAIGFTTPNGGHFDSFALDIEANAVNPVKKRNRNMVLLSKKIRKVVGKGYPLGAIVPDKRSTSTTPALWPGFPHARVNKLYDVFLPMAYSSARAEGASKIYAYTADNIEFIRARTLDPNVRVHMVGGIADRLDSGEAAAVVRAAKDAGAIGVSFYDFRTSGVEEASALAQFTP